MKLDEIKKTIKEKQYDFLRTNEHLGNNIILLGLGGSHAYGTETDTSDLDIRGCALNSKREILCNENFEQTTNSVTDTTIYSFTKLIKLLTECNPNTIEILGLKPEHYLYLSDIGRELLDNKKMFLSKKAIYSFGGYATAQFRRLDNKSSRLAEQSIQEKHILNSIKNASLSFKEMYFSYPEDSIKLYIDDAINEELDKEIFMDICLKHYPLRDYKEMWNRISDIVRDYGKIGKRNQNAISHNKLGKHMMHLVRLYIMCIDILEKEEIITYRETEHNLLMDIRKGKFLDIKGQPTEDFFELIENYKSRLEYAKSNTNLPNAPDYKKIKDFVMYVNERIVSGNII
ncbi:MAG: nucleotidyltransferase domain-containing protein [Oscillospiraceae bacterium]|nr:nucleotidyltransferase domain-containing protein [Oscillospiraceae bacterium]